MTKEAKHVKRRDPSEMELELQARGLWDLVEAVAREHFLLNAELLGHDLHSNLCKARSCLWYRLRERTGFSYPMIANIFGVDHTTVMSGVKRYAKLIGK